MTLTCRIPYFIIICYELIYSLPAFTRGLDTDLECLKAFQASVQDPNARLSRWGSSNDSAGFVCGLYGVSCWNMGESKIMGLSLREVGLSGDPFTPGLAKCTSLQTLDLSSNSFSGPLPSHLCQLLPYLTSLDLSHNQFSGDIPSSLKDCLYLDNLQLHHNLFTGQIPWQLASLPHLFQLDLSHNLLSGPIPSPFTPHSSSSSSSSSSLPNSSYPAASFSDNPQLCGPPLSSTCSPTPHLTDSIETALGLLPLLLLLLVFIAIAFRRYSQVTRSKLISDINTQGVFEPHLTLSWQSLQQATSGFSHANVLGVGGSATVYKGQLPNDQMIAIKMLHRENNTLSCDVQKQFLTELEVLGKLRHRNLVKILGYHFNWQDRTMAIILDFMPMGSLDTFLHNSKTLPRAILGDSQQQQLVNCPKMDWHTCLGILLGIAEGLSYLHHEYDGKRSVIHGDLKPGNVLLDAEMEAHIADFGLARMVRATNTTSMPTPSQRRVVSLSGHWWSFGYTAPEYVQQGVVSRKSDVFSFGVMMLEMLTGERPNSAKLEEGQTLAEWVGEALAREAAAIEAVVAPELKQGSDWEAGAERWKDPFDRDKPMGTNFGKGGMKKLVDDMATSHAILVVEVATYGLKVEPLMNKESKSFEGAYEEIGDLWPNAMELATKRKLIKETLHEAGECIQMETSWDNPKDALSVHAYITKCIAHEAIVEEKQRLRTLLL
ncbi:hypothetical protein L7F22_063171 [Adiantum nelumboides]|nr:hypothetical protein [Adiantum nelumboides]